jgi:hypothetical protein
VETIDYLVRGAQLHSGSRHAPDHRERRKVASENLFRRFGGEMPAARLVVTRRSKRSSLPPSLVRAPGVASENRRRRPPWGVLWPYLVQTIVEGLG